MRWDGGWVRGLCVQPLWGCIAWYSSGDLHRHGAIKGTDTFPVPWRALLTFGVVFLAPQNSGHGQLPLPAGTVLPQEAMDEELMQRLCGPRHSAGLPLRALAIRVTLE